MAFKLSDIYKRIAGFISQDSINTALNNVSKYSSPISSTNYKTVIDSLNDLKLKMKVSGGQSIEQSIQEILNAGSFTGHVDPDRKSRYETYDSMVDNIPIIKRGLWLYTANILSPDDITKVALKYEPKNESKKDLPGFQSAIDQYKNIDRVLKIDQLLEEVIFDTLKYGDAFIEISIADERFRKILTKKGIPIPKESKTFTLEFEDIDPYKSRLGKALSLMEADESIEEKDSYSLQNIILTVRRPVKIIKLQTKKMLLGYLYVETAEDNRQELERMKTEFDMAQIVQRLSNDIMDFLKRYKNITIDEPYIKRDIAAILETNEKLTFSKMVIRFIPPDRMVHFKIPSSRFFPYGESWLSGLEFDARLYLTDKVATVVYRVARAGERRVVYVETGVDPDTQKYIERAKNQIVKKEVAWNETTIDTLPSVITPFETIYLPRRNGQQFVEFDSLSTGQPISDRIQTNQELKNSLANGMSVPGNLLGLPEWTDNRADLTQQNVTFARLVIDLQKKFTEYTTELFQKIYQVTYQNTPEYIPIYNEVIVTFNPPQNILLESISNTYTSVANIAQTLATFGVPQELIAKKFMPDLPWDEIEKMKLQTSSEEEQMQ